MALLAPCPHDAAQVAVTPKATKDGGGVSNNLLRADRPARPLYDTGGVCDSAVRRGYSTRSAATVSLPRTFDRWTD